MLVPLKLVATAEVVTNPVDTVKTTVKNGLIPWVMAATNMWQGSGVLPVAAQDQVGIPKVGEASLRTSTMGWMQHRLAVDAVAVQMLAVAVLLPFLPVLVSTAGRIRMDTRVEPTKAGTGAKMDRNLPGSNGHSKLMLCTELLPMMLAVSVVAVRRMVAPVPPPRVVQEASAMI